VIHWIWRRLESLVHPNWHPETLVCSRRGHVVPAALVARLRPEDAGLGLDLPDGRRLARCLRCDSWRQVSCPDEPEAQTLPPLAQISIPRRGEALREAIVLRIIAFDRILHVVLFGSLFALGLLIDLKLTPLKAQAQHAIDGLQAAAANSTVGSHGFIVNWLQRVLNLRQGTLKVLVITSLVYFVLELIEAIGLWHEKRWAEYLTAVAIAGLLPFELIELAKRVTVFRVGALVINLAILAWLLYRKRLFGIGGGMRALQHEPLDPELLFAAPSDSLDMADPVRSIAD
jgi:uncharacterized membrane protein (DUF2068 family)